MAHTNRQNSFSHRKISLSLTVSVLLFQLFVAPVILLNIADLVQLLLEPFAEIGQIFPAKILKQNQFSIADRAFRFFLASESI